MLCIPSYQRAKTCRDKTISILERNGLKQATVFVVKEEYEEYRALMPEWVVVSIGVKGIVGQRQFIMEQYPPNTNIVFMDDDLEEIDLSMTPYTLKEFIETAFTMCRQSGSFIWGVYPVWNAFFRKSKPDVTTCLNFCIGCFYGIINRNKPELDIVLTKNKDDVERSLRYFIHDGIVLRFNKVGVKTKFYSAGGLGTKKERFDAIKHEALALEKEFGKYGLVKVRKNGIHEFVLKKIEIKKIEEHG